MIDDKCVESVTNGSNHLSIMIFVVSNVQINECSMSIVLRKRVKVGTTIGIAEEQDQDDLFENLGLGGADNTDKTY